MGPAAKNVFFSNYVFLQLPTHKIDKKKKS